MRCTASPERNVGSDSYRWRTHHVGDAMTIGIWINACERALSARTRNPDRRFPAGAMLILEHAGERQAGLLGLGKRAYIALAQLGQQCEKYFARNNGVGERGVAVFDVYTQASSPGAPACSRRDWARLPAPEAGYRACAAEPKARSARSHSRLSTARSNPNVCPIRTASEVAAETSGQTAANFGAEATTAVINRVDARRLCRDRLAGIDQSPQRSSFVELASPERHRTDLDDRAPSRGRGRSSRCQGRRRRERSRVLHCQISPSGPWRRAPHRHFYSLIKIDPDHAPNVPPKNGCPCRSMFRRGIDIGIFRVPLSRSKNRLNPTALLEQPRAGCGLRNYDRVLNP